MTTVPVGAEPRAARLTLRVISPGRDEIIDALALAALTMIGIAGFRPAYGGHAYLAAGAAGVLIGLLLSHAGQRARLPLLAVVTASILAFLIFGGVISGTGTVSLPTLRAITGAAVSGWQQLLTIARPVGRTSGLLALPYLLGLFSGVAGHALARRTATVLLPAAAPAVVVALSILFGATQPTAAVLQGAGFAALALAWSAARQHRGAARRTTIGRQRPWQRVGAAAAVLAVAGAGAVLIGPHLPGAGTHRRVVLYVEPPFDVTAYPSPLAGYRDYTQVAPLSISVYGKKLLATTGLPVGSRVRIAAMDSYDGLAWGVANAAASASSFGGFQRVGTLLPGSINGPARNATITIEPAYDQPWVPDLAGTTGLTFAASPGSPGSGGSAAAEAAAAAALRFNVATTTGIIPGGVPAGLRYTVSYAAAPPPTAPQVANATAYDTPDASGVPPAVAAFAQLHAGTATSPMGSVLALARYLRENGRYSNGAGAQSVITAGHSSGRLAAFLGSGPTQLVGDDEQYAATMALLAIEVGVPARVSLDGTVTAGGVVLGTNVHADVELQTAEYGWVTLPSSQFTGIKSPQLKQRTVIPPAQPIKVAPPRQAVGVPVTAANSGNEVARTSAGPPLGQGFALPAIVVVLLRDAGIPLLAAAAAAAVLIGAKALRRRRRALGPPAARVAGAWRELADLGRDLGITPVARTATRREQAAHAEANGLPGAGGVAVAADAAVFGPADPDGAAAAEVWALVETVRRGAIAPLPRGRRAWIAVNPASLWRPALGSSRSALDAGRGRLRRAVPWGALR